MARTPSPRARDFVAFYTGAARGIGWRAAQLAGYHGDEHSLRTIASRLLTNVDIQEDVAAANARVLTEGIADKTTRIRAQHERWEKLQAVIEARAMEHGGHAEHALPEDAPGAGTGLLVRTYKQVGLVLKEEWAVDTGILAEIRALEAHTAKELGQTLDRSEVTGKDGGPISFIDVFSAGAAALHPNEGRPGTSASPSGSATGMDEH